MNIRRRQQFEHTQYVQKLKNHLKSFPSNEVISLKFSREEADSIAIQEIIKAIEKIETAAKNHDSIFARDILEQLECIKEKCQNPDDIVKIFIEFRDIRRTWFRVTKRCS